MAINREYLNRKSIATVQKHFHFAKDFPQAVLFDFLSKEDYSQMRQKILSIPFIPQKQPDLYSYAVAQLPSGLQHFLHTEFSHFLSTFFKKKIIIQDIILLKLQWRDYTLLHDAYLQQLGIEFIIDFTEQWNTEDGGVIVYSDKTGEHFNLPVHGNMLALVEMKKGTNRFIQYINNHAKGKERILVVGRIILN